MHINIIQHIRKFVGLSESYCFYGCNVSTAIINGTKYYNKTMDSCLEKKYGSGFWEKFQIQLDSINKTDTMRILNSYKKSI
jgi:hypothetical protein